jgi:hypothetical protein
LCFHGYKVLFIPSNFIYLLFYLLLNSKDNELNIHHYDEALAVWGVANENEIPKIPEFQKNWDNIKIKGIIANDLIFNSPRDLARFKAMQRIRILVTCNIFS